MCRVINKRAVVAAAIVRAYPTKSSVRQTCLHARWRQYEIKEREKYFRITDFGANLFGERPT